MKSNDKYKAFRDEQALAKQIADREAYERRVRAKNDEFAALTPAEQRVQIARDVLDWLAVGKLVAENGTYLTIKDDDGRPLRSRKVNGYECHACALGSVFAVAVERKLVRTRELLGNVFDTEMRRKLEGFFTRHQLVLIEDAFEGFANGSLARATNFCRFEYPIKESDFRGRDHVYIDAETRSKRSRRRMEKIMKNIIANGGEFRP